MAYAFDTLGYARKLRDFGVPQDQAEAHADAAREFIMADLVTKEDLRIGLDSVRHDLESKIDNLGLRLSVRLGIMLAAGIAALGGILRLH